MLDKISFIGDNTMYQIYEFKKKICIILFWCRHYLIFNWLLLDYDNSFTQIFTEK